VAAPAIADAGVTAIKVIRTRTDRSASRLNGFVPSHAIRLPVPDKRLTYQCEEHSSSAFDLSRAVDAATIAGWDDEAVPEGRISVS